MTTVDSPQTPYNKPLSTLESGQVLNAQVESAKVLGDQNAPNSVATFPSAKEACVASTMASVSGTVNDQIKVAEIMSSLRAKLVPIIPEFSFSTWINGAEEVNEYAQIVTNLNQLRKTSLEEV